MFNDRNYLIISVSEIDKIDFTQICETSADTLRKSIDETKTFIKWDGEQPVFVSTLETAEGPYTHEEILEILNTFEWTAIVQEPKLVRARNDDGTFVADDSSTPDINEAWVVGVKND